jgi:hypothetical protein
MTNERFSALFGESVRAPDKPLTDFHMDVAASIQSSTAQALQSPDRLPGRGQHQLQCTR